jgi:hypothetical protein
MSDNKKANILWLNLFFVSTFGFVLGIVFERINAMFLGDIGLLVALICLFIED